MAEVGQNLAEIRARIASACERGGRSPSSVVLVAVSKTFPAAAVRAAIEVGQMVFGESRQQEAEAKLAELPNGLQWHFIGRVQRNKVRKILPQFDVIHAVDSLKLARHIDTVAGDLGLSPSVFLQVNIGDEASKGGFEIDTLKRDLNDLFSLSQTRILGLMCIPPAGEDAEAARPWFVKLRKLRDELQSEFEVALPALSMGMSGDFEVAIEEGATHVRVGSAIFGNRSYRVDGELG